MNKFLKKFSLSLLGGLLLTFVFPTYAQSTKKIDKDKKNSYTSKEKESSKKNKKNKKTTLEKKWPEKASGSE